MPELSNSFYGSLRLFEKLSMNQLCIKLYRDFENYFGQIADQSRTDIVNATHQARKALKSYRAFVKLFRDCPEAADWKPANYLLRDLGKEFSDMRDAHVRGMLLTELNGSLKLPVLQKLIEENSRKTAAKEKVLLSRPNHFDELNSTIKESAVLSDLFKQSHIDEDCIVEGFRSTFRKSYEAFSDSRQVKTEEAYHEWRKRLKDLLNQLKLFRYEQDLIENEQYIRIDTLCEEMGMLNDMAMLKEWIEQREAESAGIIRFLDKKISGFQKRLTKSGSSLYTNPDEVLSELEHLIKNE